jgi:hypothetical protein
VSDAPLRQKSLMMDVLFGTTIALLFSGISHAFGGAKVQLSDVLAIATIFVAALKGFASPRVSKVTLIALLAFLLDFLLSALFVKVAVAITKFIQLALVFSFLFAAFGYYRTRSSDRLLIIATISILAILAGNIGWHLLHGYLVGWKHLNEPKTIFILLPMLLVLLFDRFPHFWKRSWAICAVSVAGMLIFLSGERKAYIFAPIALLIWLGPRRAWRYILIPLAVLPVLLIVASDNQNGYLHRQMTSLTVLVPGEKLEDIPDSQLLDEHRPITLSNAERIFTNRRAESMWRKQPIFGIGTNGFETQFFQASSIPAEFRVDIHGEFFRALYENGIVGLVLYIATWLVSFGYVAMMWSQTRAAGAPTLNKIKLLSLIMLLIYASFESQKEIMVFATCCLPFVLGLAPSIRLQSEYLGRQLAQVLSSRSASLRWTT